MKKILVTILCIAMIVPFAACANQRPDNISTANSINTPPESIAILEDGMWPENEYTEGIPVPPGTVGWVMLNQANESCGIQINGISETQFDVYYQKLLDSGFTEIEKVAEEVKGQAYISIGSIISDGRKSISLAFCDTTLMMTILDRATDGSSLGFLESGNMTNVYVNAYATYDDMEGVQVITELYVPKSETPKPAFTMVSGMVTITLGDNTSMHYMGAVADGGATIGAAVNTQTVGESGEKGTVVVSGTAYAENAAAGGGSVSISFDITIP